MDLTTINVSSSTFMDVDTDVRSIAMLYTAYKIGQSHNTPPESLVNFGLFFRYQSILTGFYNGGL